MLKVAFLNLFRNKARTALSLLGIVIGVAAIVSLVSVVDGFFDDVQNAIGQFQGVSVLEAEVGGPPFSKIDADLGKKMERINGVKLAVAQIFQLPTSIEGEKAGYASSVRLIGTDYVKQQKSSREFSISGEIIEGRDLKPSDKYSVVIGNELADQLNKFVGNKIEINEEDFKIVGIYETSSSLLNASILITLDDIRELTNFPDDKVSMYNLELDNPEEDDKIVDLVNFRFGPEVVARSSSDMSESFGDLLGNFRLLVVAIASISAIVAGVGILNTILMSVFERFKEIGALKAVGWTNEMIMQMIIFESLFLGVIGGIIGILLGALVSYSTGAAFNISVSIGPELVLESFMFAVLVGTIAGVYPSWVASKMDPVDALRTE